MKVTLANKGKLVLLSLALGLSVGSACLANLGGSNTQVDAEKLYRAMEKNICEAKSLKVVYDFEG